MKPEPLTYTLPLTYGPGGHAQARVAQVAGGWLDAWLCSINTDDNRIPHGELHLCPVPSKWQSLLCPSALSAPAPAQALRQGHSGPGEKNIAVEGPALVFTPLRARRMSITALTHRHVERERTSRPSSRRPSLAHEGHPQPSTSTPLPWDHTGHPFPAIDVTVKGSNPDACAGLMREEAGLGDGEGVGGQPTQPPTPRTPTPYLHFKLCVQNVQYKGPIGVAAGGIRLITRDGVTLPAHTVGGRRPVVAIDGDALAIPVDAVHIPVLGSVVLRLAFPLPFVPGAHVPSFHPEALEQCAGGRLECDLFHVQHEGVQAEGGEQGQAAGLGTDSPTGTTVRAVGITRTVKLGTLLLPFRWDLEDAIGRTYLHVAGGVVVRAVDREL